MQERLTIPQAADILGVSTDTVRRRIRRGELDAERDGAAPNAPWMVSVSPDRYTRPRLMGAAPAASPPEPSDSSPLSPEPEPSDWTVSERSRYIATLEEQLRARTREVSELHVLLERQTRLLSAESGRPVDTPTDDADARPGPSERSRRSRPWWRRLMGRLAKS